MQYHEAEFLLSGAQQSQWPASDLPEAVFAGRSNAGKSSLINALVNRKNLAYAGSTPGKTRLLNFYLIDQKMIFTDAPGYGYARDNRSSAETFAKLMDPYFRYRPNLKAMVLVVDGRRKPNQDDILMCEYGRHSHLAIIVAMTKTDKLSRSAMLTNKRVIASDLSISESQIFPVDSLKKQGTEELFGRIEQVLLPKAQ
ncbi:MAG: ribosome biogenesis GTP-binding protein YihA/YsxC [Lactimicrobium sp.]|jgi:GTP-binding protein|uniref:ribosome biogenesis GTP-binding protein YihA/YsxC n=1 Tax=Lactimicrobium sp. TaxID=2563780 RepID=UPI002F3507A4